jgi:hypothetical protein
MIKMTITKNVWKAAALLLILSLITAVMISGTYAKYTSEFSGEDTALVAKWEVVTTSGGIQVSGGAIDLNLFSHEYDNNVTTSDAGVYIIAPGVDGQFALSFENKSDVAANITFEMDTISGSADVPIVFSTDAAFSTSTSSITTFVSGLDLDVAQGATATQTVYWQWPFESGDDAADTALGQQSAVDDRSEYGLTVTASAVQVQPTE